MSEAGKEAVTPDRRSHVFFDVPEYVLVERAFEAYRAGGEIKDAPGSQNVELLGTGGWALQNIPSRETTAAQPSILPKSSFNTIAAIQEEKHFRQQPELSGITYDPTAASSGDIWLAKRPTASGAGSSWIDTLTADVTSLPSPPDTSIIPLPRIMVYNGSPHPINQGYEVSFHAPGSEINRPDIIARILIGGTASGGFGGLFWLTFYGAGTMTIREGYYTGGAWTYSGVMALWQFAAPGQVMGHIHRLRIMPMRTPNGPAVSFHVASEGGAADLLTRFYTSKRTEDLVFQLPRVAGFPARGPDATGPGVPRVEVRADLAPSIQIATLLYPASGTLSDYQFICPMYLTVRKPFTLQWEADTPSDSSVSADMYDASTGTILTPTASGPDWKTYTPSPGVSHYSVTFTLNASTDRKSTPVLWSYRVYRDPVAIYTGLTPWYGGVIRDWSVTDGEADPSHATATASLDDLQGNMTTLNVRASQRVQIQTEFDPNDATKRVVLFDGYAQQNKATKKGFAGYVFPSPEWRQYDGTWLGMWVRLREARSPIRLSLKRDLAAPVDPQTGTKPPYKVTDAVRAFIGCAGFVPAQIDIPDSPVRFFPTPGDESSLTVQPLAEIGDMVVKWLRDYLGWFLLWESNAVGGLGCWRARPPSLAPYRNLATFTTAGPATGKLPHRPESYGSTNWTGTDASPVSTFIQRRSLQTWVRPPEATMVTVTAAGDILPQGDGQKQVVQFLANPASFNFYADAGGNTIVTGDPSSPDFVARLIPLDIVDPVLGKVGGEAVTWLTIREYQFTCHAHKMLSCTSPLVFVNDTHDTIQDPYNPNYGQQAIPAGYFRPLRYYDPVLVNGSQFLIRSCNPFLLRGKDSLQMARFEMEAPNQ